MNPQTVKARINRQLKKQIPVYCDEIPLDKIIKIVEWESDSVVVQEDGSKWSGILCGDEGSAGFKIAGFRFSLRVNWFTMPSGKFEITAYAS